MAAKTTLAFFNDVMLANTKMPVWISSLPNEKAS
jgi:hypothetical protein